MKKMTNSRFIALAAAIFGFAIGQAPFSQAAVPAKLEGTIKIDGSSTVYPITEAVAEEFGKTFSDVKVTVGISGTGGGFKKFCAGEIDIADASRPIKKEEIELCKTNGVQYVELPVAYDALTIVVNPKNTWAESMTIKELKKLWEPDAQGKITRWNQIRPTWPDQEIHLYGAGVDSGTYDYFTEAVVGKQHSSRGDFTSSEDDNVLVQGVAGDVNALGFFGMAYFLENQNKLRALKIDDENPANGAGPQIPSSANVIAGNYQPLSRPLFVYVAQKSTDKPEVAEFINFYLNNVQTLANEVGYVQLPSGVNQLAKSRFANRTSGSIFASGASQVGITLEELMKKS